MTFYMMFLHSDVENNLLLNFVNVSLENLISFALNVFHNDSLAVGNSSKWKYLSDWTKNKNENI